MIHKGILSSFNITFAFLKLASGAQLICLAVYDLNYMLTPFYLKIFVHGRRTIRNQMLRWLFSQFSS